MDALHPAATAFAAAVEGGADLPDAARAMLAAARQGRDDAVPLRSNIGRAARVGERTENKLDPGTVLCVKLIKAIVNEE